MADMEYFYDDLIIINQYIPKMSQAVAEFF